MAAHTIPEIGADGFQVVIVTHPKNGHALQTPKNAGDTQSQLFLRIMAVIRSNTDIIRCDFKFDSRMPEHKMVFKIPQDWLSLREMFMPDEESKAFLRAAYYKGIFKELQPIFQRTPFTEIRVHLGQYCFQVATF